MFNREEQARRALRRAWGQPRPGFRHFGRIARYHELLAAEPAYQRLPDATWDDLHLDEVFALLDTTQSRVGQQCLYHRLRAPSNSAAELAAFDELVVFMGRNPAAREQAQLALRPLATEEAYSLAALLGPPRPPALRGRRWLPWLTLAPLLAAAGLLLHPAFGLALAGLLAVNLVFHYANKARIEDDLRSLAQLGNLCRVGRRLAAQALPAAPATLATDLAGLRPVVRRLGFLQLDTALQGEAAAPLWLLTQYVKITFLLDLWLYQRTFRDLARHRAALRRVFEYVGYVDCALAVASFRQLLPVHCAPTFAAAAGGLRLLGAYHPLVPGCVPNSLHLPAASLLLTGANMAGKTTFMRTVGLCAVLAQTIATCPARRYEAPFRRVSTCIAVADSLLEGTSYYFAEVARVGQLVAAATAEADHLFVLDELFKGTNTVERIAATRAVLAHLSRHNLVVASTHDGELAALLGPAFELHHFTERVAGPELVFDYRLRPGPLTTRNALQLLALAGYPAALVREATATAAALDAAAPPGAPVSAGGPHLRQPGHGAPHLSRQR